MRRFLSAAAACLAVSLAASLAFRAMPASAQVVPTVTSITKPAAGTTILIATPQASMNLLTTAGVDPKEEWNQNATKNIASALADALKARSYATEAVDPSTYSDPHELQVLKLNDVVTSSLQSNIYQPLPTKTGFDWTLGEGAASLRPEGDATPAAYILFIHADGNYSSGGRVMMGVLLAAASGGNAGGQLMAGGTQILTGTLVDLNTGKVVWYNSISFLATTDLRTPAGDTAGVASLLKTLPL